MQPAVFKHNFDEYHFFIILNFFDSNKPYALSPRNRKCTSKIHIWKQRWAFRNLKRKALVAQLPHVAKRFNKSFLAIALRFKENKSSLRFIALQTEKIYNSVRIIALRTEKNLVACALLRCALLEVEILRCALSD